MTEAAAPYDPALAFSIHSALVGVHGAALSYAPFVPNSLCVVEIGTYLNWYGWPQLCFSILDQCALMPHPDVLRKNGRGDHEWRSSGFIARWSPETIDWVYYRLPPQEFVPAAYHRDYFQHKVEVPRGQADRGCGLISRN